MDVEGVKEPAVPEEVMSDAPTDDDEGLDCDVGGEEGVKPESGDSDGDGDGDTEMSDELEA